MNSTSIANSSRSGSRVEPRRWNIPAPSREIPTFHDGTLAPDHLAEMCRDLRFDLNPGMLGMSFVTTEADRVLLAGVDVKRLTKNKWSVEITKVDRFEVSTISGVNSDSFTIYFDSEGMKKCQHEMVAIMLFGRQGTDVAFRDVTPSAMLSDKGNMSPDCMVRIGGSRFWFELKTTKVPTRSLNQLSLDAYRKYRQIMETEFNRELSLDDLYTISVGPNSVCSNVRMPQHLVNELTCMMKLGNDAFEQAKSLGLDVGDGDSSAELMDSLFDWWLPPDGKHRITPDMVASWETTIASLPAESVLGSDIHTQMLNRKERCTGSSKKISDFEEANMGKRQDCPSIVQLPLLTSAAKKPGWTDIMSADNNSAISRLWSTAMVMQPRAPANYNPDPYQVSFEPSKHRIENYQCYKIDTKTNYFHEIQRSGFMAKRVKEFNAEIRDMKHESFSIDCATDDIDAILDDPGYYFEEMPAINDMAMNLIEVAVDASGGTKQPFELYKGLRNLRIFRILDDLHDLLMEINLSLKNHSEYGTVVIKELKNCMLMCRSCGASNKIFFSIAAMSTDGKSPFDKLGKFAHEESSGVYYTDFLSLDRNKISNLFNSAERVMLMYNHFSELAMKPLCKLDKDVMTRTMALTMCLLVDNQNLVDFLQLIRFSYMSVCANDMFMPDPFKVLSKAGPVRNRLYLCLYKRYRANFTSMIVRQPVRCVTDRKSENGDHWENLVCWITGSKIQTFEVAINLSYFGTYHNKDEGETNHGFFRIFDKVLKMELLMRDARAEFMGHGSPRSAFDLRTHEFSVSAVKMGCKLAKETITKESGMSWDSVMEKVISSMDGVYLDELKQFKSSAIVSDEMYTGKSENGNRRKVLEGVIEVIEQGLLKDKHLLRNTTRIIAHMEHVHRSWVFSNLFKKNQINGIREIFILDIYSRLIIKFIEKFFECLGYYHPAEMLTKGSLKIQRGRSHFIKIRDLENFSMTSTDSDDASTWCQQFVMPLFGLMVNELAPQRMKHTLFKILNMVADKRLELPSFILEQFRRNGDCELGSNSMLELKRQFLGRSEHSDLVNPGSQLLKNTSNMMQGILHNTSSFLAVISSEYSAACERLVLKKFYKSRFGFVRTDQVSSDDSGVLRTLISKSAGTLSKEEEDKMREVLTVMSCIKEFTSRYFCVRQSYEKSTPNSFSGLYEFNSFWLVANTYCVPTIKYCYSSINCPVKQKFDSRFNEYANVAKQLLESGASTTTTALARLGQAMNHYSSLGSRTSKHFSEFYIRQLETPCVSLGFFPLEPLDYPAVLGHNFAKYTFLTKSPRAIMMENAMLKHSLTSDLTGTSVINASFLLGDSSKFRKFMKKHEYRINQAKEWANTHPEILYSGPKSGDDQIHWVMQKCFSSSIAESFSFDGQYLSQAASVYILNRPCISMRKIDSTDSTFYRASLLESIRQVAETSEGQSTDIQSIDVLYPLHTMYDSVLATNPDSSFEKYAFRAERLRKVNKFQLIRSTGLNSCTLSECCKALWFGEIVKGKSNSEVLYCIDVYKHQLEWLKDDVERSLEASPFLDHIEMSGFVQEASKDFLTITLLCEMQPESLIDALEVLTRFNKFRNMGYVGEMGEFDQIRMQDLSSLESRLCMECSYPKSDPEVIEALLLSVSSSASELEIVNKVRSMPENHRKIMIMADTLRHRDEVRMHNLIAGSRGSHTMYIKAQSISPHGDFYGSLEAISTINGISYKYQAFNKNCTIYAECPTDVTRNSKELLRQLKSMGMVPGTADCTSRLMDGDKWYPVLTAHGIGKMDYGRYMLDPKIRIEKGSVVMDINPSESEDQVKRISWKWRRPETTISPRFRPSFEAQTPLISVKDAWRSGSPLKPEAALRGLNEIVKQMEKGQELTDIGKFLWDSFKARLGHRGYVKANIFKRVKELLISTDDSDPPGEIEDDVDYTGLRGISALDFNEDDLFGDIITDGDLDFQNELQDLKASEAEIMEMLELRDQTRAFIMQESDAQDEMESGPHLVPYFHPLFDLFIMSAAEDCLNMRTSSLWSMCNSQFRESSQSRYVEIILKAVGNDDKPPRREVQREQIEMTAEELGEWIE